jgi:hypothetical protein
MQVYKSDGHAAQVSDVTKVKVAVPLISFRDRVSLSYNASHLQLHCGK